MNTKEIVVDFASYATIIGCIIGIILIPVVWLKFFFAIVTLVAFFIVIYKRKKDKDKKFKKPKKPTISIKIWDKNGIWWSPCHIGKKIIPSMVLSGILEIENLTDISILPTSIRMKKPKFYGHFLVEGPKANKGKFGTKEIAHFKDDNKARLIFRFYIMPAVVEKGEDFKTDLAIYDQFGNKHWIRDVTFQFDMGKQIKDFGITKVFFG